MKISFPRLVVMERLDLIGCSFKLSKIASFVFQLADTISLFLTYFFLNQLIFLINEFLKYVIYLLLIK